MKPMRFFSLRYKFLVFSLLLTLVPLLFAGFISDVISTKEVQQQESDLNLQTLKQIGQNIEFVTHEVNDISLHLFIDPQLISFMSSDYQQAYLHMPSMQISLYGYIMTKKYVYSIDVLGANGISLDTSGAADNIDTAEIEKINQLDGTGMWSSGDLVVDHKDTKVLSYSRLMRNVNDISKVLGMIRINVSTPEIRNIYAQKMDQGLFYIMNQKHEILSSLNENEIGKRMAPEYLSSKILNDMDGYYTDKIQGQKYLVVYDTLPDTGWKLIRLVPLNLVTKQSMIIKRVTLYSILICLFISGLFISFFNFKVLQPLKQFRKLMKNLENENFNMKMKISGNDEMALLGLSFNKMSRRLDELINEVYAIKIKQREAEYEALVEQINPHFLYNTLDSIHWMSRIENAFETSEMVQALSMLFRLGLNNGEGLTTVRRELEHLQNYIVIQKKKYEQAIEFSIRTSEHLMDCAVMKLVLQPLVENAILHGIEKNGGFGHIDIHVYEEDQKLCYQISDDGAGTDGIAINEYIQRRMMQEEEKKRIGLRNVNDRIQLTFGYDYGLYFASEEGVGTTVTVVQPLQRGKQDVKDVHRG